ncbi:hypothetical protein JZ751_021297 [Albula glossodonta]|uniref:Uncharacterized protein n=1 Tax=Albula glossodonta TaxID=121402 RepID=A0A8T2MTS4_9TELE|nr:hypothetical protein JZ751_021297 [Albula glossodonta]
MNLVAVMRAGPRDMECTSSRLVGKSPGNTKAATANREIPEGEGRRDREEERGRGKEGQRGGEREEGREGGRKEGQRGGGGEGGTERRDGGRKRGTERRREGGRKEEQRGGEKEGEGGTIVPMGTALEIHETTLLTSFLFDEYTINHVNRFPYGGHCVSGAFHSGRSCQRSDGLVGPEQRAAVKGTAPGDQTKLAWKGELFFVGWYHSKATGCFLFPTFLHSSDDGGKVVVQQNHVCSLFGDVRPGNAHGHSNIGLLQRRGVIHPVSCHCHNRPLSHA